MNWTEVKIYTTTEGIEPLTAGLMNIGIKGFIVEDAADFEQFLKDTMAECGIDLSIHDFRVVIGESHTNLIFDLVIPYEYPINENEICSKIAKAVEKKRPNCYCVITVDRC